MINTILTKIFGSQHEREVKKLLPVVAAINEMEPRIKPLSDDELRAKTAEFRTQLDNGAPLDDLLSPPSRWSARPPGARSTCGTSTCS